MKLKKIIFTVLVLVAVIFVSQGSAVAADSSRSSQSKSDKLINLQIGNKLFIHKSYLIQMQQIDLLPSRDKTYRDKFKTTNLSYFKDNFTKNGRNKGFQGPPAYITSLNAGKFKK